ncbi:hypothetical protein V8E53_015867 [Lactarius tabidus]
MRHLCEVEQYKHKVFCSDTPTPPYRSDSLPITTPHRERRPEREQQQEHHKLEEGEIATSAVTVDAGGAPEDEIRDSEELETCGREACEKPKKLMIKKASKSKGKKWELRPHIQSDIDPPHQRPNQANKSAKHPRRNTTLLILIGSSGHRENKKPKRRAKAGPYEDWKGELEPPPNGLHRIKLAAQARKRTHLVDSDELEEVGGLSGLSENEGLLEAYCDDSGAAGDATSGASDPRYYVGAGGTISRKLMPRTLQRTYATTIVPATFVQVPSFISKS